MSDDERWMIRGVGKGLRKAIKEAARSEGVSIGIWVRRALEHALESARKRPTSMFDVNERLRLVEARLELLEKAQRKRAHQPAAGNGGSDSKG